MTHTRTAAPAMTVDRLREFRARPGHERCARRVAHGVLGCYVDGRGAARQIVTRPGAAGSVLVLDRDAGTGRDLRLVAHLAADEPAVNAALVCHEYLNDARGRWCRRVTEADIRLAPFAADRANAGTIELRDRLGRVHRLEVIEARTAIPELRWRRCWHTQRDGVREPVAVSLREVVAALESYEPARAVTVQALARGERDARLSVTKLRAELERLDASRIVLNRGLREAVLAAVREQGLSLSEIALRCGRRKCDGRGRHSGETSWLARRIGLLRIGGEPAPTPWIHSEVLALIARRGLGVPPREVELG